MGFLTTALIVGVVGAGVISLISDSVKDMERKGTPCNFDNGIDNEEFTEIVKKECRAIKRITNYEINGASVRVKVRSQSGISDWKFTMDFNDYGKISGRYWLSSKNGDSKIPETVAERIKEKIIEKLKKDDFVNEDENE